MARTALLVVGTAATLVGLLGCTGRAGSDGDVGADHLVTRPRESATEVVRLLLAGDVETGPGAAEAVRGDPGGVFAEVRHLADRADVAMSAVVPSTGLRPGAEPDPVVVQEMERAGFGLLPGGGGSEVVYVDGRGVTVAFLTLDTTDVAQHGSAVRSLVTDARASAEIVVVGLHGGADDRPGQDLAWRAARRLASWGVQIVWGHAADDPRSLRVLGRAGGGSTLVLPILGELLTDPNRADRAESAAGAEGATRGGLLEVVADRAGVVAYRLGSTEQVRWHVHFDGWEVPDGDAVLLGDGWWTPARGVTPTRAAPSAIRTATGLPGFVGDVVDARRGDATGDGRTDLVVSFRREYRPTLITAQYPERRWADRLGRAAHLGVYAPDGRRQWVAGTMFRPVARLAVCDGALALAFDELDRPDIVATSAWRWEGFGFTIPAELPGPGEPGCIDIDGDGRLDPYIERNAP